MNAAAIYQSLEDKMLRYVDLVGIPVEPMSEAMVPIEPDNPVDARPVSREMIPYTGDRIYVRESVLDRLGMAAQLLAEIDPKLQLQVVYGYRALSVQRSLFSYYKNQFASDLTGEALMEATHRLVAVPSVAGHPTGGAVDIRIVEGKRVLDMGTDILEFVKDTYTFSPFIGAEAKSNRALLRKVMLGAGFAPFDGEWWHFSYGDKEWAAYYKEPFALYEQIEFKAKMEGEEK